ncbi:4-oxalocrotonate tautomerase family protein [Klebsiella michiganensis]|uniref:4-oxalocrotonate tautomerase family protein n=1 Tax=Klebsiella michiganensis TaxID=1134687 RepID=UPI0032D9F2DD
MPTYIIHYPEASLEAEKKQSIAKGIAEAHEKVTGAPRAFAQILFREIKKEDWYIGGKTISSPFIFLFGFIRSGRETELKHELIHEHTEVLVKYGKILAEQTRISLSEIPASQISEYGQVVPEPGAEKEWIARLPEHLQAHFADQ